MDRIELSILEKACSALAYVDVQAKSNIQVYNAVIRLESRKWIEVDMRVWIYATPAGRAALADYHQTIKDASRAEAKERTVNEQKEMRKNVKSVIRFILDCIIKHF